MAARFFIHLPVGIVNLKIQDSVRNQREGEVFVKYGVAAEQVTTPHVAESRQPVDDIVDVIISGFWHDIPSLHTDVNTGCFDVDYNEKADPVQGLPVFIKMIMQLKLNFGKVRADDEFGFGYRLHVLSGESRGHLT